MSVVERCRQCKGELQYEAPVGEIVAPWFASELIGWLAAAFVMGAFAAFGANENGIAMVVGAVAAVLVFAKLTYRWNEREHSPNGWYFCPRCMRRFRAKEIQSEAPSSAI